MKQDKSPLEDSENLMQSDRKALGVGTVEHLASKPSGVRTISAAPPANPVTKRGARLLAAVHELHKAGYQRLRVSAGWSACGSEWRCRLLPAGKTGRDGWKPHDVGQEYHSAQGKDYFDWKDCGSDDARTLARKILQRFPELMEQSAGEDWGYAGWFLDILGRAEHGELPAFYCNGFMVERSEEATPLPPAASPFASDELPDTNYPLVANEDLSVNDLPPPNADEQAVIPFCLSFDGYAGFRSAGDCIWIADRVEREGLDRADIDSLRIAAFIRQREIKWASDVEPADSKYLRSINAIVSEIRHRLESKPMQS